jgi:hypothetical protein
MTQDELDLKEFDEYVASNHNSASLEQADLLAAAGVPAVDEKVNL